MIEFLIGICIGAVAVIFTIRRYQNRDGKVAEAIRRAISAR